MSKTSKPRRGSLQYSPRVRAKRIYPNLKAMVKTNSVFGGFAGYKVGMLQIKMIDNKKGSVTYGKEVVVPATLLEVPDLFIIGAVSYDLTPYGLKARDAVINGESIKKYVERKIKLSKTKKDLKELDVKDDSIIRAIVSTQPWLAGIGKKTPEIFEVPLIANSDDAFKFLEEHFNKPYGIENVFSPGMFVDVIGVTKGKGFEGSVKRFGVKIQKRGKSDKPIRRAGTLGPWHPAKTSWRVPQHGQHGYHRRTEHNKYILDLGNEVDKVQKPGGWLHYGVIKSKYLILKGSVMGPAKRLIMLRHAIRPPKAKYDDIQIEKYLL